MMNLIAFDVRPATLALNSTTPAVMLGTSTDALESLHTVVVAWVVPNAMLPVFAQLSGSSLPVSGCWHR